MKTQLINTSSTRISTRIAFFIAGFGMGAWAPLIPYAQTRLNLDAGMLGMLLFCLGCGSLLSMVFSGRLSGHLGCRTVIISSSLIISISLPLLASIDSLTGLMLSVFLFGAGVGLTDVTVNIQGTLIEQHSERPLMSGFHGFFSIGGIAGSGGCSIFLSIGFNPLITAFIAGLIVLLLLITSVKNLIPFGSNDGSHDSRLRLNKHICLLAIICLICFLAEGSMLDWSGVWLAQYREMDISYSGWGYAVFALSMAFMRLTGDRIVHRIGRKKMLTISGLLGVSGYLIAVFLPGWLASLVGFAIIGLGAANVAPVTTTLAGKTNIMPANMSVAFISTIGYLGILMGPALIGFVAHNSSLKTAFILVAVLLSLMAFISVSTKSLK